MKKTLSALVLLGACVTLGLPQAFAQAASSSTKKVEKKAEAKAPAKEAKEAKAPAKKTKKADSKAAAKTAPDATDDDDKEPDTAGSDSVDYACALGDKVVIYENLADKKHIALRWNKRLHRLTRVETTTGANRYENRKFGLVWIGIPAKGMLLDSKKGQQLANECRNAEQMKPAAVATSLPAPGASSAAPAEAPKN
jgi:hypothetical protein